MDMQMPVMDVLEATGDHGCWDRRTLPPFRAQAEAAGGDGFISKPFNLQKFESVFSQQSRSSGVFVP
jgi:CheY-like chemotaxis protein